MRNALTICRKELRSYFVSPVAYGLMAFFALIIGYFFWTAVVFFVQRSTEAMMGGASMPMNVNEWVIRPVLSNISVISLFLVPMISMRLFAEEKRSGTYELLATSPVRDFEIIAGKWLAAVILYACILALSLLDLLILYAYGKPDWKPMLVGYLGLLLQGGCLLAIGAFISTTTRSQIVAGVATFAIALLLWVLDWVTAYALSTTAKVIGYISVLTHFESFARGVIDTKDIVFYVSMIFLGLFLTARSLESAKWRA
jgi:ABC-2 type transport system permease protein